MKKTLISIFLLASVNVFAQTVPVSNEELSKELQSLKVSIQILQKENNILKSEVIKLKTKLSDASKNINDLKGKTLKNSSAILQTGNDLGVKIKETEEKSNKKIEDVDSSLVKSNLYSIIGIFSALLLSGFLYWQLSKRQKIDKSEVINQLQKAKTSIEESLVKEFVKQTSLIESELQLLAQNSAANTQTSNTEPNHSLALKVANEINLIERNINLMNKDTKGLKQLLRSVGKLRDNLCANGYDIPEMLGMKYNQGMKVIVTSSIPDENLEKGSEIITKILIPQVNFNDKMIQTAQIEVSVGM